MMYRSGSATHFSNENFTTTTKLLPLLKGLDDADELQLPVYEVSKKQRRLTLGLPAESLIHVIPVVLLLCVFILWFNSELFVHNL